MKRITIQEVEYISFALAKAKMEYNEPIPDFSTRYPNVLESCLSTPFQTFDGKLLYPGLAKQAAILFYLLNKNHPFKNGNKRIAITTLFYFLYKNDKWLNVDNQKLYLFAVWVASSLPELKDGTLEATSRFIKNYLTDLPSK